MQSKRRICIVVGFKRPQAKLRFAAQQKSDILIYARICRPMRIPNHKNGIRIAVKNQRTADFARNRIKNSGNDCAAR